MDKKEDFSLNSSAMVDGIEFPTHKETITACNIIEVEVGTTGHMGGDTGHGGRTYFKIDDHASTDMRCRLFNNGKEYEFDNVNLIELMFGGDTELDTFCEALRIGYEVLSREAWSMEDYTPTPLEMRQERFALYINELCEHYRKKGSLKGMGDIRTKHHITGLTQQQFFECDLHHAKGYVSQDFCNKVYAYVLDTSKAVPAPKYDDNNVSTVMDAGSHSIVIINEDMLRADVEEMASVYPDDHWTMEQIRERLASDAPEICDNSEWGDSVSKHAPDRCFWYEVVSIKPTNRVFKYNGCHKG